VFAAPAQWSTEVLYVVGGLYGNPWALAAVEAAVAAEGAAGRAVSVVFNGDFHWFDIDRETFAAIEAGTARHLRLRGNVETELAGEDSAAGCGCAYPESVGDDEVARSNLILAQLRETARAAHGASATLAALAALPMHAVARVGAARVAIVHGDLQSLAGWDLAHDRLHDPAHAAAVGERARAAGIDIVASSHTCLPVAQRLPARDGDPVWVFNNGAAGMPNFSGEQAGLITRIATTPPLTPSRYGARALDGRVFIDALDLHWPAGAWQQHFLAHWPAGSAAHASYWRRIVEGPSHTPMAADRTA
jgi:hypothetical protein